MTATCIGGAAVDRRFRLAGPAVPGTSNPASVIAALGGVARNVAEGLARLGDQVRLVSRVGRDEDGRAVRARAAALGIDVAHLIEDDDLPTASYTALLSPAGDLVIAASAMGVLDRITPADVDAGWGTGWVFLDGNLGTATIGHALARARADGTLVALDPVSVAKAARLPNRLDGVAVVFCNAGEASALAGARREAGAAELAGAVRARGARAVVLTLGADGALVCDAAGTRALPAVATSVVDVTGAGDALAAATLHALMAGQGLDDAVRLGTVAAALTVASRASVRPDIADALS